MAVTTPAMLLHLSRKTSKFLTTIPILQGQIGSAHIHPTGGRRPPRALPSPPLSTPRAHERRESPTVLLASPAGRSRPIPIPLSPTWAIERRVRFQYSQVGS